MSDIKTKKAKATEVVFDVVRTLILIGSDADLLAMFQQKFGTDIKLSIASAKADLIKPSSVKFIKGIFEKVILTRPEYIKAYQLIESKEENTIPKWYGKKQILADIEAQGSPMTEQQRMMLKVNDLKNVFSKLNRKGIANTLGGADTLSDTDCRNVIASITQLENKLKKINIL